MGVSPPPATLLSAARKARFMEISWFGHSCFRLRGREATIITDPFARSIGLTLGRQSADIVTISHETPHHAAVEGLGGAPRVLRGPGEYEVRGVMIQGISTPGERAEAERYGRNTAYAITIDEVSICHLGDLGSTLSASQIEALKDPDVLLVPVGGGCTIGPAEVAEVVSQLEPKIVIPMHYGMPGVSLKLEPIERFCREMAVEEQRFQPKLSVTHSSVPSETTVVLLEATAGRKS
jgi:L-ascorbate metabolism protein UlaG (beta-lactamase superfamily)